MERRGRIESYFPDYLLENKDFHLWIEAVVEELGKVGDMTELFAELGAVDKTPPQFLQDLADIVAYKYMEGEDADVQREVIKRVFSIYERRGTEQSIIEAGKRGGDPNWVGGDLTLYKDPIKEGTASVLYPINHLFRHSISKHSSGDPYADNVRWREGVIIIRVSYLSDLVKEAIEKVIPAGMRYYIDIVTDSGGEGKNGEVSYGDYFVYTDYYIAYELETIKSETDALIHSGKGRDLSKMYHSGRQILFYYVDIDRMILVPLEEHLDGQIPGIQDKVTWFGLPRHSTKSYKRSGKYGLSGAVICNYVSYAEVQEVWPYENLNELDRFSDLKVGDYSKFLSPPVEVKIGKERKPAAPVMLIRAVKGSVLK